MLLSRDGNFRVHLEKVDVFYNNSQCSPSDEMLQRIKVFETLLFSKDPELLNLTHPVLKESKKKDPYYIAPLEKTGIFLYCYKLIQ